MRPAKVKGRRMKDELEKKLLDLKTRTKHFALRLIRLYSAALQKEANELTAILVTCAKSIKARRIL